MNSSLYYPNSKTCLKRLLENRQNKDHNDKLNEGQVLQNAPIGAFCNTFDMYEARIGLENQFWPSF